MDGNTPNEAADAGASAEEGGPEDWKALSQMLAAEWSHVLAMRGTEDLFSGDDAQPVGLALSGGGIRSATFSLGVLQALAQRNLLSRFDYLSTVSGGGYIGAWLAACIRHASGPKGALAEVEARIRPSRIRSTGEEPTELRFLRAYSNYLTPRLGVFSGDTLAAVAGFLRNLGLNLVLGVMSVGLLLATIQFFVAIVHSGLRTPDGLQWAGQGAIVLLLLSMAGISMLLTLQSYDLRVELEPRSQEEKDKQQLEASKRAAGELGAGEAVPDGTPEEVAHFAKALERRRSVLAFLMRLQQVTSKWLGTLLGAGVVLGSLWLGTYLETLAWHHALLAAGVMLLAYAAGSFYALLFIEAVRGGMSLTGTTSSQQALNRWMVEVFDRAFYRAWTTAAETPRYVVACALSGVAAWGVVAVLSQVLHDVQPGPDVRIDETIALIAWGPLVAVGAFWLLYLLWMGTVGNSYSEFTREWLSRIVGSLTGLATVWVLGGLLIVHAVPAWTWAWGRTSVWMTEDALWAGGGVVLGLIVLSLLLRRLRTPRQMVANSQMPDDGPLASFASLVAVLGVLGLFTILFERALMLLPGASPVRPPAAIDSAYGAALAAHLADLETTLAMGAFEWRDPFAFILTTPSCLALLAIAAVAALSFWAVDVNTFSLQNLYRNRLVRCYLGAAHYRDRLENPYAGFDPTDDFELGELANQRPYPLMSAAINITQGADLAWQQRKAASFLFSPLWCGFWLESSEGSGVISRNPTRGGYVKTSGFVCEPAGFRKESKGVMVGTAIATSGAAVSSQMGFASRGPLSFLLTLLNVRLGRWLPNPARRDNPKRWSTHSPPFGAFWYLSELLGVTNERSRWVYVSDGGHFENTGMYELVRRRCRLIVCVDAGADPYGTFGDLGNAVRKCRIDFGVDIHIDTSALRVDQPDGTCKEGVALGTIDYPVGPNNEPRFRGHLVYIKPSLPRELHLHAASHMSLRPSEAISADVAAYRARNREFPHEPTSNQWFTESQFESYRELGYLLGMHAMQRANELFEPPRGRRKMPTADSKENLTA